MGSDVIYLGKFKSTIVIFSYGKYSMHYILFLSVLCIMYINPSNSNKYESKSLFFDHVMPTFL